MTPHPLFDPDPAASSGPRSGQPQAWLSQDQAFGLRQMFGAQRMLRFVPVAANPQLTCSGIVLERVCSAIADAGLRTLVVDAGERAGAPRELAEFDLREGIEALSPQVSYLSARGLPVRHVDACGSSAGFLTALAQASSAFDVVLVHADAADLARMFSQAVRRDGAYRLRPLILTDLEPPALTQAYAAIKVLAARAGLRAHDLIVCSSQRSRETAAIAARLAQCADSFLSAVQHQWLALDPAQSAATSPDARLCELVRGLVSCALPLPQHAQAFAHEVAALPARPSPVLN